MGGGRPLPGRSGGRGDSSGGSGRGSGGGRGPGRGGRGSGDDRTPADREKDQMQLEAELGFDVFTQGPDRLGWLMNISPSEIEDSDTLRSYSCINCYFMCQDGGTFKAQVKFAPYFYIGAKDNSESEVEAYLRRKYEGRIQDINIVEKEDLDMKNHLSGSKHTFLKVACYSVKDLMEIKREVLPLTKRNQSREDAANAYDGLNQAASSKSGTVRLEDFLDNIIELREFDVPYHNRFCIDTEVRCGHWFHVKALGGDIVLQKCEDLITFAEVRICAFDIETSKQPLQFPNAVLGDQVIMISYMLDKQGYLITNREFVSEDINDFEYTPKPEFHGPFIVWNEPNEKALLRRWFDHMRAVKPGVYVTYNGDFFDFPFIQERAKQNGMSMFKEIGFHHNQQTNEVRSRFALHLDALCWVKRDSYLPQGSQGLKAVTRAKLGYDPLEVHPEDMVRLCWEDPQKMASYSVSDAVCTYYLYMKYVHPFIFSLATIIPMSPDEVLRKGSGTLCETLLMVEAFRVNVVCPNKHESIKENMHGGHLLESETYIGGHVEALQSGVFRSDIPCQFHLKRESFQELIDDLDRHLEHAIAYEGKMDMSLVTNYDEVRAEIEGKLRDLMERPHREELPLIYHLDVAAMYPNIILTNRLQPPSVVSEEDCQSCDFNKPGKTCLRKMDWVWRGETYAATRAEYVQLKRQIETEKFDPEFEGGPARYFRQLSELEQQAKLTERFKKYNQRVYKRVLNKPMQEKKQAGICMRENSFYVDTVRSFRDRRYEYKGLNKKWKGKLGEAQASKNPIKVQEAADMCVLYDSLQLAHKCILNSFYGYVMRKGARWYSMEMAGVVTHTGANIIQKATRLVNGVGKPLELDTDGIWCCLPTTFPDNFKIKSSEKGKEKGYVINYPCVVLNKIVMDHFTNDQYQTLVDPEKKKYDVSSECSIEFEVDGPYKAMILPASKDEGKLIKKRYAVFNDDGTLAELKGFEIKRRGELKLIKVFQSEVFGMFLEGDSLETCYAAVAGIANRWLDMLENRGCDLVDDELMELIGESTTLSKSLEEYGDRKSTAITTATRLGQFLGSESMKDKVGLNCSYVVAKKPEGAPTSQRAIPTTIFSAEPAVARSFIRKWIKEMPPGAPDSMPDVRDLVDWDYYTTRLGSAIQKIITIPAALQKVPNPVPRVKHPDWLGRVVRERNDTFKQLDLGNMFHKANLQVASAKAAARELRGAQDEEMEDKENNPVEAGGDVDMEDMGVRPAGGKRVRQAAYVARSTRVAPGCDATSLESGQVAVAQDSEAPESEPAEEIPDKSEDFQGWLSHMKKKWRADRERKRQRRDVGGGIALGGRSGALSRPPTRLAAGQSLGAFFRQREAAITHSHWQVIQFARTTTPGEFVAWIVVGGAMYSVPVRVPRRFYINMKHPDIEADCGRVYYKKRVHLKLPHGHPTLNLYEVDVSEAEMHRGSQEMDAQMAHPDVEGVYESKAPLIFQTICAAGCTVQVSKHVRDRALSEGFALDELEFKTTVECPYLPTMGNQEPLRHVTVYHSSCDSRSVFVALMPAVGRCVVVVVSPVNNREVTNQSLARWFQDSTEDESVEMQFEIEYETSEAEAHRRIQRELDNHQARHRGPTVALLQSPMDALEASSKIAALQSMPCVEVKCNSNDNEYETIGWQQRRVRLAMQRCAQGQGWLEERVALARYAHIPLGNFGDDALSDVSDVFFARALRDEKHLLWASELGEPDFGGAQLNNEVARAMLTDDSHAAHIVSNPGAYRRVCVRLRVHHLAVNTLHAATTVAEMEGGNFADTPEDMFLEGAAAATQAFRVLRSMVMAWLGEACERDNTHANSLLQQFFRWLCNPKSALQDPLLQQLMTTCMQKVFRLLLCELRKLGCTVVYADFTQIIICTGKHSLESAYSYVESLSTTLSSRDLFKYVLLNPEAARGSSSPYWHSLVFHDLYNLGGMTGTESVEKRLGTQSQGALEGNELDQGDEEEEERPIYSSWNMAEFMPPLAQEYFEVVVSEFVYLPWKETQRMLLEGEGRASGMQDMDDGMVALTPAAGLAADKLDKAERKFLENLLETHFTEKLLRVVRDMQKHMGAGSTDPAHQFPKLCGSHLCEADLGPPALAFVQAVVAVFQLDKNVEGVVTLIRRNLLRLLHVGEFSPQASFRDPCVSFVLPDVLCTYCNNCRDLDICRDPQIQDGRWICEEPSCEQHYDMLYIENQLVQIVKQRVHTYQLQDLKCTKCKQVKIGHMAGQCKCGGGFVVTIAPKEIRKWLNVFRNIAEWHNFDMLGDTVSWLLEYV